MCSRRSGVVIALVGSFTCTVCAFAQEPAEGPDAAPPGFERVLRALERVETEQRALRQEIEALGAHLIESVEPVPHDAATTATGGQDIPATEIEELPEPMPVEPDGGLPAENGSSGDGSDTATGGERDRPIPTYRSDATLFEQGREAFRNLDFYGAAKAFREFLAKYPQHEDVAEARYWLGETLYKEGQFREAVEVFADVISDEGSSRRAVALLKTGYARFELGDFDRAQAILTQVRDQNPGSNLARLAQLRLDRLQRQRGGE